VRRWNVAACAALVVGNTIRCSCGKSSHAAKAYVRYIVNEVQPKTIAMAPITTMAIAELGIR
jgi:hypothetical protein